jgi:hypothetical protein
MTDMYWVLWPDPGAGWGASGPYLTEQAAIDATDDLFGPGTAAGMTIVHGRVAPLDAAYAHTQQQEIQR